MLKKLKNNIRARIIGKALAASNRMVSFPSIHSIKTVGLITDKYLQTTAFNKKSFYQANFTQLTYSSQNRPKTDSNQTVFGSDLNFWGIPSEKIINWFTNENFDLLIDCTLQNNDVIDYICAKSKAKFKVSMKNDSKTSDLMINQNDDNLSVFFDELDNIIVNFNTKK